MKRQLALVSFLFAGMAGISQAAPLPDGIVNATLDTHATQTGHLIKVARVFLGYDQFGRPVYGYQRLPRVIIGYNRFGRPIYGRIYNNRPLFLHPNDYGLVVRPFRRDWDWGHRRWNRGFEHRMDRGDRGFEHRDHGDRDFRHHDEH